MTAKDHVNYKTIGVGERVKMPIKKSYLTTVHSVIRYGRKSKKFFNINQTKERKDRTVIIERVK